MFILFPSHDPLAPVSPDKPFSPAKSNVKNNVSSVVYVSLVAATAVEANPITLPETVDAETV